MRLLRYVGIAQWKAQGLGGDMGALPMSSNQVLRIIGPMWALASPSE
jgi:hypothetical protein